MTTTQQIEAGRLDLATHASGRELKRARHAYAVLEVPMLNPATGRPGHLNARHSIL
jgi:hypothetical protein